MRLFCLSVALYLDRTVVSDQLILHAVAPQSSLREVFQQVGVHNLQVRPNFALSFSHSCQRGDETILLHVCRPETLLKGPCACRCCWCRLRRTRCSPGSGQWRLWAWEPAAGCSWRHVWGRTQANMSWLRKKGQLIVSKHCWYSWQLTWRFFPLELSNPTNLLGFYPTCHIEAPGEGSHDEPKHTPVPRFESRHQNKPLTPLLTGEPA